FTTDSDIPGYDVYPHTERLRLPSASDMKRTISSYLKIKIQITSVNYGPPDDEACPADKETPGWTRPRMMHSSMIGHDVIVPMPYSWGNKDTPKQFLERVSGSENTSWLGNICTNKRGGLGGRTAGVDCSGLISRIWEIKPKTTSELQQTAIS